ncbi:hypothetical protein ACFYX8_07415 [Streptomyces cyaneofuscatus]|uniref:hypothetical protein n=1 Tax=Streptomyces cyaneofuscatus TaxID=66883 RepID=UPI0036C25BFE
MVDITPNLNRVNRMEMIGFFREMAPGSTLEIFRESIQGKARDQSAYPKAEVQAYLESGHPIFDIMETTLDVIEGSFRVPGGSSLVSDGRFVWRADLSAYVETYNIGLPPHFISFAVENGFSAPPASLRNLLSVSAAAERALGFRVDGGAGSSVSA